MSISEVKRVTCALQKDPIYDLSHVLVRADNSTARKGMKTITCEKTGSWEAPLTDADLIFHIKNDASSRTRIGTSGFLFETYVANGAKNGDATNCSLPEDLVAELIRHLTAKFNGQSDTTVDYSRQAFIHHFHNMLLRFGNLDALNKRGDILLTPIGSDTYTAMLASDTKFDPDAIVLPNGNVANGKLAGAAAAVAALVASPQINTGIRKKRWDNYVQAGAASRPIYLFLPFSIALGLDGITTNITDMDVNLGLNVVKSGAYWGCDCLEHLSMDGAGLDTADGRVYVGNVSVLQDIYYPNEITKMSTVADKKEGETDVLSYLQSNVDNVNINAGKGTKQFITVSDFQSLLMYQPAQGLSTTASANGAVLAKNYVSPFEFFIGNSNYKVANAGGQNTNVMTRADQTFVNNSVQATPLTDIQIEYGSVKYPDQPISTQHADGSFNPLPLFHEYLKATGVGTNMNWQKGTTMVSYDMFKKTMPFIYLSPWSNNGVHLNSEPKTLTVYWNRTAPITKGAVDGGAFPITASEPWVSVITTLKSVVITADRKVYVSSAGLA